MPNLSAAVDHAHRYWYRPCADQVVWTKNQAINIAAECRKRGLDPRAWVGLFLSYDGHGGEPEGLFLVPAAEAVPAIIQARSFHSANYPNKVFLCSWYDAFPESIPGPTGPVAAPYHGLNDCSHFVSECLQQAGVNVWSVSAVQLVANLRARADTKTLCLQVNKEAARRIINSGLLTPGDVIAFSDRGLFRHATLSLGGRNIAMHTYANHPFGPAGLQTAEPAAGPGATNNWEVSANPSHPDMTLIHFSHRDVDPSHLGWFPGWWQVTWRGQTFYYHFTRTGRAAWTAGRPASLAGPPARPGGKGYWFVGSGPQAVVTWRDTGTLDQYLPPVGPVMAGRSSGEPVTAVRLGP